MRAYSIFANSKVMEYVNERASLYELTKTVKAWERKVEISEVGLAIGVSGLIIMILRFRWH